MTLDREPDNEPAFSLSLKTNGQPAVRQVRRQLPVVGHRLRYRTLSLVNQYERPGRGPTLFPASRRPAGVVSFVYCVSAAAAVRC